jgi:Helix-turn-helix domain
MSIQAMAWAYAQQTGDVHRKAVLICLANHDQPGGCFPSIDRIRQETEIQSRRTVQKKIDELVEMGLVVVKEHYTKSGRQTSNRYFLAWAGLPKVEDDQPLNPGEGARAAPSLFDGPAEPQSGSEPPSDEGSECHSDALKEGAADAPRGCTGRQGEGASGDTPEGASHDTPRTVIGTVRGTSARVSARDPQDDLFQAWWEAYPQQGHGFSKDRTRIAWLGLSPDERKLALRAAEYMGPKSRMGRGKPKDPYYWLADKNFATIAEERGWTKVQTSTVPRKVFVEEDTEQWEEWAKTRPGKPFPKSQAPGHRNMGWWFDSEWPPGHERAA